AVDQLRAYNQLKVLRAFQHAGIAEAYFGGSTGYGYGDEGRTRLEKALAEIMAAEAALLRLQISTGTQAISMCFFGILRPGDELVSATGDVYDSLRTSIGHAQAQDEGSLRDFGIKFKKVALRPDGSPDLAALTRAIGPQTKMVLIQRSRGYASRPALGEAEFRAICQTVQAARQKLVGTRAGDLVIMADNCYGEFTARTEPCQWGADLVAGSLIKNPGGGLAPTGGYVAGRERLVDLAAARLSAPGLNREVGPTLGFTRQLTQGLYMSPHVVGESLKGMILAAEVLQEAGFETSPGPDDARGDIIQTVTFGQPEPMCAFCEAVQAASPVDSFVTPVPGPMPGYEHDVIMAAGAFVSGSSVELSADGPLCPPYTAYMQGGLVYDQVKLALMIAVERFKNKRQHLPE
ncbi:MAG: methionine gamma-lyase family protein, partial [Oscillospiraceae bacterium]|nr:methionine gamma-lyase family protein [Oscillospiraceae bacterium]